MGTYRSCGRPIDFIRTKNGKLMPVDLPAVIIIPEEKGGNFVTRAGEIIHGKEVKYHCDGSLTVYRTYWATCPAANNFRRE